MKINLGQMGRVQQLEAFEHRQAEKALLAAQRSGIDSIIAHMPQLLYWRGIAPTSHPIHHIWFTALSEEDIGRDIEGKFVGKGEHVYAISHGACILDSPERLKLGYKNHTDEYAAKLSPQEFRNLLHGELPGEKKTIVFNYDEFIEESSLPDFHKNYPNYSIVIPFAAVKESESSYQPSANLVQDPLFIVRAGGMNKARTYFEKSGKTMFGNWHPFRDINPDEYQGRLLILGKEDYEGIDGTCNLYTRGCFVKAIQMKEE